MKLQVMDGIQLASGSGESSSVENTAVTSGCMKGSKFLTS